jgi:hypothetical protein
MAFDYMVGLDVLEHIDNMQSALEAILFSTRRVAFVCLPNMAHISHRFRFLFSGHISDKYNISVDAGIDRHRWLPTTLQSDSFVSGIAQRKGFEVQVTRIWETTAKKFYGNALRFSLLSGPNSWVWSTLYKLTRVRENSWSE